MEIFTTWLVIALLLQKECHVNQDIIKNEYIKNLFVCRYDMYTYILERWLSTK